MTDFEDITIDKVRAYAADPAYVADSDQNKALIGQLLDMKLHQVELAEAGDEQGVLEHAKALAAACAPLTWEQLQLALAEVITQHIGLVVAIERDPIAHARMRVLAAE